MTEVIVKDNQLQISKISDAIFDVIVVYRSSQGSQEKLVEAVRLSMSHSKPTLVVGDINLCSVSDNDSIASRGFRQLGFAQMVTRSTHIKGELY